MVIVYGDIPDKFFVFLKYGDLRYADFSDIRNYGNVTYDTIFFLISYCLFCKFNLTLCWPGGKAASMLGWRH